MELLPLLSGISTGVSYFVKSPLAQGITVAIPSSENVFHVIGAQLSTFRRLLSMYNKAGSLKADWLSFLKKDGVQLMGGLKSGGDFMRNHPYAIALLIISSGLLFIPTSGVLGSGVLGGLGFVKNIL